MVVLRVAHHLFLAMAAGVVLFLSRLVILPTGKLESELGVLRLVLDQNLKVFQTLRSTPIF